MAYDLGIPEKKKEKGDALLARLLKDYETAKAARQPREERWIEYDELFRSINPEKPKDGLSNLFIPETEGFVRTAQLRMAAPFLNSKENYITGDPRKPEDVANAKANESLIFDQLQKTKFGKKNAEWVLQKLVYGGSPALVDWEYEMREVEREEPQFNYDTLQEETIKVKDYVVSKDGPRFQPFSIWDWYIDPEATCMQDARYGIRRHMVSADYLRALKEQKHYKNIADVLEQGGTGDDEKNQRPDPLGEDAADFDEYKEYELLEYWDNVKKRLYIIASKKFIIRDGENPFPHQEIPVVWATYKKNPFEFYGKGIPEALQPLQDELNLKRNQRSDYVTRVLNPMWLLMRGTVEDADELESRPGGIIVCNDIDGVKPLPIEPVAFTFQEEQLLKAEMANAAGISENDQGRGGAPKQTRETATEVQAKMQMSGNTSDFYFKEHCDDIAEVVRLIASMNTVFVDEEKVIKIIGEEGKGWMRVAPENVSDNYDFSVVIDPQRAGDQVKLQQAMQALNLCAKIPGFNLAGFAVEIMKLLGFKDAEKWFAPPAPPQGMPGPPGPPGQDGAIPPEVQQILDGLPPEVRPFVLKQLMGGNGGQPPQEQQGGPLVNPQSLERVPSPTPQGALMGGNMISR